MRRALALSLVSALWAGLTVACGAPSAEEQTLRRFFAAAPTLDTTVIRRYAAIGFNPQADGIVQSFRIASIGPEHDERKDVAIDAVVRAPGGAMTRRRMTATLQRVDGRWILTGLRQTPASQTSRAASSDRPS